MTKKELIEKLQKLPDDSIMMVEDNGGDDIEAEEVYYNEIANEFYIL